MLKPPQNDAEVAQTLGLRAKPKRPFPSRHGFLSLFALLALVGGYYYWQTMMVARTPRFEVSQAKRGNLTVTVTATGTLQPVNTVEVGAEISGRLERVPVDFNAHVKKGETLAEIDTKQLRAQVERSEAGLEAAEAGIKQAQATLLEASQNAKRAEQLAGSKLIPEQELDAARATLARSEAAVASAKAQVTVSRALLNADRTNLEKAVIRSPIDGIVLARKVEPGQTVAATFQTPILFKLAEDLTRMKLIVNVDEADVGMVREAQSATFRVDAYPDREFSARITSVRNEPLTVQGVVSYEAILTVDNSEELLRPGMTATSTIRTETRTNVLLVPNAALRFVPPGATLPTLPEAAMAGREATPSYVWILRDTKPAPVRVKKGITDGRFTEMLSGEVAAGMKLLVDLAAKGK
ncbi:MAG: efflux RND transporter periplasmic adaptor subunit [Verrucomicrobiota bacterium]